MLIFYKGILNGGPYNRNVSNDPSYGLRLLLQHMLDACTLWYSWKNTQLYKTFEHITSQSMCSWGFHHRSSSLFLQIFCLQCLCLSCAKNTLKCIFNYEQFFCSHILEFWFFWSNIDWCHLVCLSSDMPWVPVSIFTSQIKLSSLISKNTLNP